MKKEKIIKKFKENIAETYPNKWGGYCWAFCVEDLEEIADELLTLIEQEKKEVAREIIKRFGVETEKAWGLNYLAERIAKEYEVEL